MVDFIRDKDGDYTVVRDGVEAGHLCKRHNSGSGRALAGFVGATKPYDYWVWRPERGGDKHFDKFTEAKKYIRGFHFEDYRD
jgi:hypothetical protein